MARSGPVGGAATLSSFRVQKAFSINFRENKRLFAEIKLIENEHIRNIRQVKQDIKETRIWLDNIRESTGYSQHGIRPETDQELRRKGRRKKIKGRSKTAEPSQIHPEIVIQSDSSDDESDTNTRHSDKEAKVRFAWANKEKTSESSVRPWTDAITSTGDDGQKKRQQVVDARKDLKSEPAASKPIQNIPPKPTETQETVEEAEDGDKRQKRIHSAASGRSSLASMNTYQRRRKLQSMMMKKRNPLDIKKEMNSKDSERVNGKVQNYLAGLNERMQITLSDLSLWNVDLERHETPFAQDVNVTV